jgi:glycosyltransferase involved in cell wall biosynthesis
MTAVLHISQATQYGLERYLTDLLQDQAQRGWRLTLACPSSAALEAVSARTGAEYRHWESRRSPGPSIPLEMRALRTIVADIDPDVVHLHSSKAGLVGRLTIRGRRPTLFSPHAWSFLHEGSLMQRASLQWERWGARWADVVICGSAAERARGQRAGIHGDLRVVPNSVDLGRFSPAAPGERALARDRLDGAASAAGSGLLVACVGRLVPQKGPDLLLDAWREVHIAVPDATLVMIGDGELRDELVAHAPAGVVFAGPAGDVRDWFVAADLVVQPSRWETLSLSVLEALACGRAVVATDVEGMREAIGEDAASRAGAIVAPDAPVELAGAVVALLRDHDARDACERRAAERAARFGLPAWGDAIAAIVTEAAARPRAQRTGGAR